MLSNILEITEIIKYVICAGAVGPNRHRQVMQLTLQSAYSTFKATIVVYR